MILISLIGAIIQLLIFALLPFLVYVVTKKSARGFFSYIGIHTTSNSAVLLAILAGLVIGAAGIAVMLVYPDIRQTAAGKGTVPEQIKQFTSSVARITLILIIAFIKTALAEELLFRGFVAKKLIGWLGYNAGNLVQAVLFGAIHVLLFLSIPGVSTAFLTFSFLTPGISGYLAAYLNEKTGKGSIYPGWIMHGLGNFISYTFLVFINS